MRRSLVATSVVGLAFAAPGAAQGTESWLQPETLSQAGTANDSADLAVNSPGVAALIWTEFKGTRTPRHAIRVSSREPDQKWAASEQISDDGDGGSGAVGVDPQGRITAVWDEAGTMWWATKAKGQPWTAGEEIPDGDGGNPDLFVASDGTATAVWQSGPSGSTVIRASRRPPGGAWSEPETISPTASARSHIEGDTAGNVTVSYTQFVSGGAVFYAVRRPNSGPWGSPFLLNSPASDYVSELVVAPNSGQATVFWQNGAFSAPLAARTSVAGTWGSTQEISGGTPGRLDLDAELDRAAADGTGLVTAVWISANKVHSAYRTESPGSWTAPTPPAVIDPGDGSQLGSLQIASSATSRAYATWRAEGKANRWSTRGVGPLWSAPKPIDGVPADAWGLDLAVDDTHRVAYVWSVEQASNVSSLAVSTYGDPLDNPQPPASPGPAPPAGGGGGNPPPGGGGSSSAGKASAALQGTPTSRKGVTFVVRMPAAGSARIVIARAGKARAAAFRRVGTVRVKLEKGRNVVRVKRVRKRKLAKGRYRATIRAKAAGRALAPVRVDFRIRR